MRPITKRKIEEGIGYGMWIIMAIALTWLPAAQLTYMTLTRPVSKTYLINNPTAWTIIGMFIVVGLACVIAITYTMIGAFKDMDAQEPTREDCWDGDASHSE